MFGAALILLTMLNGVQRDSAWGVPPPIAPYGMEPLPAERVVRPMIFPVLGKPRWKDGYGDLRGSFLHTGIDIRGPKMTPIVAPISGTLGFKTETFWIYDDEGWAVLGTHLNDDTPGTEDNRANRDFMFAPDLVPGQRVEAGRLIGYVGNSGDATAPHLHFELFAAGEGKAARRIRNPFPSLKNGQVITAPRAVLPASQYRPTSGQIRLYGCRRGLDVEQGTVTMILVSKQTANGTAVSATAPRFLKLRISEEVASQVGGWSALRARPSTEGISFYVPNSTQLNMARVERIMLHPVE